MLCGQPTACWAAQLCLAESTPPAEQLAYLCITTEEHLRPDRASEGLDYSCPSSLQVAAILGFVLVTTDSIAGLKAADKPEVNRRKCFPATSHKSLSGKGAPSLYAPGCPSQGGDGGMARVKTPPEFQCPLSPPPSALSDFIILYSLMKHRLQFSAHMSFN